MRRPSGGQGESGGIAKLRCMPDRSGKIAYSRARLGFAKSEPRRRHVSELAGLTTHIARIA